jgi:uncharacterized protein
MPHENHVMPHDTFARAVDFLDRLFPKDKGFLMMFHGGEPLLAGLDWYRQSLALIREKFGHNVELNVQSNIWLLSQEWIDLFGEYGVSISTSLDGPKEICDSQRGEGYFEKTMKGIRLLKENGRNVSVIATLGRSNISPEKCRQMFRFFLDEGIRFSLHGAVPSMGHGYEGEALTADEMLQVLLNVSEEYFAHYEETTVGTIDHIVKNIYHRSPCLCTFSNCLGTYLAIDTQGYLYSCQRFCGMHEFSLGKLSENPTSETILNSKGYAVFEKLHQQSKESCTKAGCRHIEYCNGGCCYAALAEQRHGKDPDGRDPFCRAFRSFYDELDKRMTAEMSRKLLKEEAPAPLLAIAENRRRAYMPAANARKIVEASQWQTAPAWLQRRGPETVFFNITYNCPLRCTHCWADAGTNRSCETSVGTILKVIDEAFALNFRQIIFSGGEPLFHKDISNILLSLADYRKKHRTPMLTLQTSLAIPLTPQLFHLIAECFTCVNVSIDGNREQHDERRGKGSYDKAVANIIELRNIAPDTKVVITPTLSRTELHGTAGAAVQQLAKELGKLPVEVRELKHLGRNSETDNSEYSLHPDIVYKYFVPQIKCGLGNHLHIEPDGSVYPCYIFINDENYLGNAADEKALEKAVHSETFLAWKNISVDSNPKCSKCDVRYICGGVCRIRQDCGKEYNYYKKLVELAGRTLEPYSSNP